MAKDEYKLGQSNQERKPHGPGGHGPGPRMGSSEKAADFIGTWKKLLNYCKKYNLLFIFSLVCAALGTVLTLIGPDKLSELTDIIQKGLVTGIDMDAVTKIGLTLVCFYLTSAVFSLIQGQVMASITQKISKNLRSELSLKINRLPMSFFSKVSKGDVLSRVTNDVDTVGNSLNQSIATLVSALTLFIGSLVMMLKTNVILTITAIVASLLGFMLMMLIMSRSQKYFTAQQKNLGLINGHIEEVYAGHTIMKAYNGEKEAKDAFDKMNFALKDSGFKAQCLSGLMMPLMSFVGNFGYVAVCVVGGMLAINGSISFGVIVAFMMYVRYFTQPLSQIAQATQNMQSAAAAGERVFDFLKSEEMENESSVKEKLTNIKGQVEFEHVKFGYDPEKVIIHDFSAIAMPGQKIAIVGPTGAGKTTMVNLLMRF